MYDNSHIQGSNAVGAMIVAGSEGFRKRDYRKFNIRSAELNPGDDFAMMREVLTRRFKRLLAEAPSQATEPFCAPAETDEDESPGQISSCSTAGRGNSARRGRCLRNSVSKSRSLPLPRVRIAMPAVKPSLFPAANSFKLPPRDPVLYFVERLRDEAHRFAVGSHRARRTRDLREAGLQEIEGIGPTRKRALLHHFGTLKAIERASVTDLMQVDGISAETARRVYEFFHEGAA